MAQATSHPDRRLISSEDVQGTDVYGAGDEAIGGIDHLLIDKVSGRVLYAVMSFGGFLGLGHSHYPIPGAALKYDTNLDGLPGALDEMFELFDNELLIADNAFHHVANRNYAN